MATPTFEWTVNSMAGSTFSYTTRSSSFGDGYVQTVGEGVNNRNESWEISWTGTITDLNEMLDFFDALGGWKSFFWVNPLGKIGLYRCVNPSPTEQGGNVFTLSGTFTKAYAA